MMKLQALKQKALSLWKDIAEIDQVVLQPEHFKAEVKTIGDLRRKATWERAIARFEARIFHDCCLDAYNLIVHSLNFGTEGRWDYFLKDLIIEEFLSYPDGLDMIRIGLEDLFKLDFSAQVRDAAYGLSAMVQQQLECRGNIGQSVGSVRQPRELTGATSD
jgi:hypothetical protein